MAGASTRPGVSGETDFFVSHASEDKDVARPLSEELRRRGYRVWFDEFVLKVGDSLRQEIDRGLALSRFGVVLLSPHFFAKRWPLQELNGLAAREGSSGRNLILPIWHGVGQEDVAAHSPMLADRVGVSTTMGIPEIADQIERAVRSVRTRPERKRRLVHSFEGARPDVDLVPSVGASPEARLVVANNGVSTRLMAKCTISARRNDRGGQALRTGSYSLKWIAADSPWLFVPSGAREELLLGRLQLWYQASLAEMDLPELTSEGLRIFETSRWNMPEESLPEYDLEICVYSDQSQRPHAGRYTLRPARFSGPLELAAFPTTPPAAAASEVEVPQQGTTTQAIARVRASLEMARSVGTFARELEWVAEWRRDRWWVAGLFETKSGLRFLSDACVLNDIVSAGATYHMRPDTEWVQERARTWGLASMYTRLSQADALGAIRRSRAVSQVLATGAVHGESAHLVVDGPRRVEWRFGFYLVRSDDERIIVVVSDAVEGSYVGGYGFGESAKVHEDVPLHLIDWARDMAGSRGWTEAVNLPVSL